MFSLSIQEHLKEFLEKNVRPRFSSDVINLFNSITIDRPEWITEDKKDNLPDGLSVIVTREGDEVELNYLHYFYDDIIVGDWLYNGTREKDFRISGINTEDVFEDISSELAEEFEEILFVYFNLKDKVLEELSKQKD